MKHIKNHTETGFTLLELLVVLGIIAMLAGIVGPQVMKHMGESKTKAAKVQIEDLAATLDMYKLDLGGYPTSEEGLNALIESPEGVKRWNGPYLSKNKIPLTVCPLSNLKLKVVTDFKDHPLRKMLQKGLHVTLNSDDPAYFGGYINENYLALAESIGLTKAEVYQLAKYSFEATFLTSEEKENYIKKVDEFYKKNL